MQEAGGDRQGQTVTAGPSDSWVIEFRVPPDEGPYLMLSHAVGSTARGAIGVLVADANADTPKTILAVVRTTPAKKWKRSVDSGSAEAILSFWTNRLKIEPPYPLWQSTVATAGSLFDTPVYPATLIIDREGYIRERMIGLRTRDELWQAVAPYL